MERQQHVEINELKQTLLKMAGLVEAAIDKAIRSLTERDAGSAREIIEEDPKIDQIEIQVENQCLSILARHQPVAVDLRFLFAAVKMNNDLERMGDHAVNIAQNALNLVNLYLTCCPQKTRNGSHPFNKTDESRQEWVKYA